jgi:tetrahydromethanopterin S-methyltransferase subunit G
MDDGLGFLAALFLAAERESPNRDQLLDRIRVQRLQRAVALAGVAQAIGQDIARRLGILQDLLVGRPTGRLYGPPP